MPCVECPKCGEWLEVSKADFGRTLDCRSCGAAFPALVSVEDEEAIAEKPDRAIARQLLRGPALALMILAIISIVASCVCGAGMILIGLSKVTFLRGSNEAGRWIYSGLATAVFGSLYYTVVLVGSVLMRKPRHRFWPILGSLFAVAAILFCWTIPVLNLVNCGFGFWALRRLYRAEVREYVRGAGNALD